MKKINLCLGIVLPLMACAYERYECESAAMSIDLRESEMTVIQAPALINVEYGEDFLVETNGEAQVRINGVTWVTGGARCSVDFASDTSGIVELSMGRFSGSASIGMTHKAYLEIWSSKAKIARGDIPLEEQMPHTYGNVVEVELSEGVTSVCEGFFDNANVSELTIPESLEDLGVDDLPPSIRETLSYDEDGCMVWNGWLLDFENRQATTVSIPDGVVGIGREAFAGMEDLSFVDFPASLRHIGNNAFELCTYLDEVEIPAGVETIGAGAFKDCSWIQNLMVLGSVRKIGERAFSGCSQLAKVVWPDGLESIESLAFEGCWRMQSISLPSTLTNVVSTAFSGCSSLVGITMPTGTEALSVWLQPIYTQIKYVTVPIGETSVVDNMFAGCSALEMVSVPEGVSNICDRAFYNCGRLQSVDLPQTLTTIGQYAFYYCNSLSSIVLPENVQTIGSYAFYYCTGLTNVTLSRSLKTIPDYAFYNCGQLQSLVVPASVGYLGSCSVPWGARSIYFLGDAPGFSTTAYQHAPSALINYAIQGSKGWDGRETSRDLPELWPVGVYGARTISYWVANKYDVVFDANGGSFPLGESGEYSCQQITDTPYSLPPCDPVLGGAKFSGYWTEPVGGSRVSASTAVRLTKAHTLYAHWDVAPSITVRFNAAGGTVVDGERVYTAGDPYGILPVATRNHYDFDGWYTAASGGNKVQVSSAAPYADQELFAHWEPKSYAIVYHSNNAIDSTRQQAFVYGESVSLLANRFSCYGCEFAGWSLTPGGRVVYADKAVVNELSAVQDGLVHLFAAWTGDTYAVRFDANGGKGVMDNQTLVLAISCRLATNAFFREGFEFNGWAKTPSGTAVYSDGDIVVGLTERQNDTVSLYATWVRSGVSLSEALGGNGAEVSTSGSTDWISDDVITHDGRASVRTVTLDRASDGECVQTTLMATIKGSGSGHFWWRVNCEPEYYGDWYDYGVFAVDGNEVVRIAGDQEWVRVDYAATENSEHTLTWSFVRDDFDEDGADWENLLWVDDLVWNRDLSSYTVSDILNEDSLVFSCGGNADWIADTQVSHDGVVSLRSGTISHSQQSWIETSICGPGELSFWWKSLGQVNGSRLYDYVKVELDGQLANRLGVSDWTNVVLSITNAGSHIVRWTYLKNASVDPDGDCAWLDDVHWEPAKIVDVVVPAGIAGDADLVISSSWFDRYPNFSNIYGADRAAAMLKRNGKVGPDNLEGYVWQDYVAGTDPTDESDTFKALLAIVDGKPVITASPELDPAEAVKRKYTTLGKVNLNDNQWVEVPAGHESDYKFFKVTVEMK